MIQWIGSGLLLAGSIGLGIGAVRELRERTAALGEFQGALELMERELSYSSTGMPELLELLARDGATPVEEFFSRCKTAMEEQDRDSFGKLWRRELKKNGRLHLHKEDLALLERLGDILGRYDSEGQCAVLARSRLELTGLQCKAREDQERLGRIYRVASVALGTALVILLI